MWIISILVVTLCAIHARRFWRNNIIQQWCHQLDLNKHAACYQQLFHDIDGFFLSKTARGKHDAFEYTYGEIQFTSFIALISLTHPNAQTVFYDLGSGVGKAVLACAMVFDVQKSCGIELFHRLSLTALHQKQRLLEQPEYQDKATKIHFIHSDFLRADFSDATLVFINATALFGETWLALNQRLAMLCPNAIVLTTSKALSSNAFEVKKTTTVAMSWGLVKAYLHQPIRPPDAELSIAPIE
jgi:hypothetical protein